MSFPNRPLTQLRGSNGPVHALTYSAPPSTYILTGSADRSIRLYNPSRPSAAPQKSGSSSITTSSTASAPTPPKPTQLIQTYTSHTYAVLDLSVAHDNATFTSCGGDRTVFLWDVATGNTLRRWGGNNGHVGRVNSVTFAGEGDSLVVSGGYDGTVRIWDVRSGGGGGGGKPVMVWGEAKDAVQVVMTAGAEVYSGSVDGRVRCYDVRKGKVDTDVIGKPVVSLDITRDGQGILVGALDGFVRLMDRRDGALLRSYKGAEVGEYRVGSCFGGLERWVVGGSERGGEGGDGECVVWDTMTGEVVERVRVPGLEEGERKKKVGRMGEEKESNNVVSKVAWKDEGRGDQWCCAGTDGLVTVFGPPAD